MSLHYPAHHLLLRKIRVPVPRHIIVPIHIPPCHPSFPGKRRARVHHAPVVEDQRPRRLQLLPILILRPCYDIIPQSSGLEPVVVGYAWRRMRRHRSAIIIIPPQLNQLPGSGIMIKNRKLHTRRNRDPFISGGMPVYRSLCQNLICEWTFCLKLGRAEEAVNEEGCAAELRAWRVRSGVGGVGKQMEHLQA